ncbi:hypothetical protein Q1695_004654 [Nippostrongylus brasiliensis]|nr:hypothetical protein Q1695_004654 [Nippostrongylus brasiliensis]
MQPQAMMAPAPQEPVGAMPEQNMMAAPEPAIMQQAPAADVIPEERRRNFMIKPGYAYFLVTIVFTPGVRFGLGVKHYRNQVIVSKVESGSMVSDTLKVLDRVCDVCSKPVTDKEVCKTMIVKALQNNGCVDMIIERPVEAEAIQTMENALNASKMQQPSVAMASDVKDILRRYNEKLKQGHGQMPVRRALSDPNANAQRNAVNVKLNEGANKSRMCQLIGSDFTTDQENQMMKVPPRPSMFGPPQQ